MLMSQSLQVIESSGVLEH
uniref:Uncharacterized protein n=1 Tax=Anguilla anguilla TaxID=7936 RepID=A0A0E9VF74_ANGAN